MPFRFLDLTQELRNHIYQLLIHSDDSNHVRTAPSDHELYARRHLMKLRYLRSMVLVNRQIHNEFCDKLCAIQCKTSEVDIDLIEQPNKINGNYANFSQWFKVPQRFKVIRSRLEPASMFIKHMHYVAVEMCLCLEHDESAQLQATSDLISALAQAKKLRSVIIWLWLYPHGKLTFSWVKRELERFKAIQGFQLAIVDVSLQ